MAYSLLQQEESRNVDRVLWLAAGCVCVWILAISVAVGQQVRPRFLLTPSQIVSAMENRQLPTRGVKVSLAAPITSVVANPQLEVQAVALLSSREMRLRMTCRDRSECLSFFAIATFPEEVNATALKLKPDSAPAGVVQRASFAKPVAEAFVSSATVKSVSQGQQPILHSGSPATLDFDGERVHVRVEVICLESGAAGDKIRVTTRDHRQVYVAEIVTSILLKGTF